MTDPLVYDLYGIRIRTPWPIPNVPAASSGSWDVEFVQGDPERLDRAAEFIASSQAPAWAQAAILPDGSTYRRWSKLFDFLVPPGARRIEARMLEDANEEAFQAYLLVDGLSHAMVRLGREPLHAAAVMTAAGAAAFLGASGRGKSTLAALFVAAGYPLLTDDMLIASPDSGAFIAQPGPPRIKLYRAMAARILGRATSGVPMNPATDKLIIPLGERQATRTPGALRALYVLEPRRTSSPGAAPSIRRLRPADAVPRILAATASVWPCEPARLRSQFAFVTAFVRAVPIKALRFAHDARGLCSLRDRVVADLNSDQPSI